MPRYRTSLQVVRSDSVRLDILKESATFSSLDKCRDTIITVSALSTSSISLTDLGTLSQLFVFPASTVKVSINGGTAFDVSDMLVLPKTSITSLSVQNTGTDSVDVRLLIGA